MCDGTADKVKEFDEKLGISPEKHKEIDARLDRILKEWQKGELKIAGTMNELFEHWDAVMAGKH